MERREMRLPLTPDEQRTLLQVRHTVKTQFWQNAYTSTAAAQFWQNAYTPTAAQRARGKQLWEFRSIIDNILIGGYRRATNRRAA